MTTEDRRITRRTALAGMAGATVAAVTSLPAVAGVPQTEHLTPEERTLLDVHWRLTKTQRKALKDFAELGVECRKEHAAKRIGGAS